ncbi:putative non-specific serine/threonine protein kinase [Helianthus annuus]|nr:putative non-specific serine/threonine protein kinase [Helianthus annuus]KAJ0759857.1 putative non-specific serine/threonine protein kinase [Helianthus annuus]KAJ0929550.1 putative non-specific serine/threonine protein kinase [Helianthus annuus]
MGYGFCELKNLHELDLSYNMFDGNVPECFNKLTSLRVFDVSSNRFTGILLSSLIDNLTSLEYVDFSNNIFESSFSFSSLSAHKKLEVFKLESENYKCEVETEEPKGWIPMSQLKILVLSKCNIRRPIESVVPGFLLHQHKLRVLDLSHNSLDGQFPYWLIKNNTNLEVLILRNNSFQGLIHMALYKNANTRWLDMSGNHMLGEVPKGLFGVTEVRLSNNILHGEVLRNSSLGSTEILHLDNNCFTGNIGNSTKENSFLTILDISDNHFTGTIPRWTSCEE